MWRSLRLLLTRPGAQTLQYLAGHRKHHAHPPRLYMTLSLMLFLTLPGWTPLTALLI